MIEQLLINLEKAFEASVLLGLGASFLAGILSSFSPCVYPLIPITLAVVGAASAATRFRAFLLSFVFVLGITVVYTVLGAVSSFFGILMGTFHISPVTYIALTVIFLFLSASEFGIVKINIPFSAKYSLDSKKGLLSIFILGMVSSFAMIPCNFPVLGGILALISLKKSVLYGAGALFVFSLGYGVILLVLGVFASLIRKLPKQGKWTANIKKSFGVIFAGIGLYFLWKFFNTVFI